MNEQDVCWIQRLNHYQSAVNRLKDAVNLANERPLTDLEQQGLIQAFEFTHELAWNTMKDFLESRGTQILYGSKDATCEAYKREIIQNGDAWMSMIRDRNLTSHTYNEDVALDIAHAILDTYIQEFIAFWETMDIIRRREECDTD